MKTGLVILAYHEIQDGATIHVYQNGIERIFYGWQYEPFQHFLLYNAYRECNYMISSTGDFIIFVIDEERGDNA